MTAFRDKPVSLPLAALGVAAILGFTMAWMIAGARARGVWIDEIWSLWMSQHDIPVAQVFAQRWTHDVHPLFFHALNWLLEPMVGMDIARRRLLNLIPLTYFLLVSLYLAARYPRARRFALVFVTLVIASHYSVRYFAEHRSYFSGMCFTGSLMVSLYCAFTKGEDVAFGPDFGLAALLVSSAISASVIHYVGTIIVGSLLAVSTVEMLRQRRFGWAGLMIASGVAALALLIPCLAVESAYVKSSTANFWIKTGPVAAAGTIVAIIGLALLENLVAAVTAGLILVSSRGRGEARLFGLSLAPVDAAVWRFVAPVAAGLALAAAALFAVNEVKPIVVSRYLIPLTPISASLVAALVADQIFNRTWLFAAFLINAALVGMVEARHPLHDARWNGTMLKVEAQAKACPSLQIYALAPDYFSTYTGPPNQPEIQEWGYRELAQAHGFRVTILDPRSARPIALSAHCPTLFWGEHINKDVGPVELAKAPFTKSLPGGANLASAGIYKGDSGFIVSLPAQDLSRSTTSNP